MRSVVRCSHPGRFCLADGKEGGTDPIPRPASEASAPRHWRRPCLDRGSIAPSLEDRVSLPIPNGVGVIIGAQLVAARIRAGVRVGRSIELLEDGLPGSTLVAGDRGLVVDVDSDGFVTIELEGGRRVSLHPDVTRYRPLPS